MRVRWGRIFPLKGANAAIGLAASWMVCSADGVELLCIHERFTLSPSLRACHTPAWTPGGKKRVRRALRYWHKSHAARAARRFAKNRTLLAAALVATSAAIQF